MQVKIPTSSINLNIYNALDYGAKGNGVVNDRHAIHAACLAAHSAGGGVVYLPPGSYRLNNADDPLHNGTVLLYAMSDVHLKGAGVGLTTLLVDDDYLTATRGCAPIMAVDTLASNWSVEDMTIDWNGANNLWNPVWGVTNTKACYIGGDALANVRLERLKLTGCPGMNVIALVDAEYGHVNNGALIRDVEIVNCGNDLLSDMLNDFSAIYTSVEDVVIENCYIRGGSTFNQWNACGIEIHHSNTFARHNWIENYRHGVYVTSSATEHPDGIPIDNINLLDNDIVNCVSLGILVWLTGNSIGTLHVTGNRIRIVPDAAAAAYSLGIGNTYPEGETYVSGTTEHFVATENTIIFPELADADPLISCPIGIGFSHTTHAEVNNNRIYNALHSGIRFTLAAGEKFNVLGNVITGVGLSTNPAITITPGGIVAAAGGNTGRCNVLNNLVSSPTADSAISAIYIASTGGNPYIVAHNDRLDWVATNAINIAASVTAGSVRTEDRGAAAPTTGYHSIGSIRWNISPSAGGVTGWVCVTAGSPGTWTAISNLAA